MLRYGEVATFYSWGNLVPVPQNKKTPVPKGFTGASGRPVGDEQRARWRDRECNVALVMPREVIGIDVDEYTWMDETGLHSKNGLGELRVLEKTHGALPPTWTSTGRDYESGSGIRFYRIPEGSVPTVSKPSASIEIIRHDHRYAVVWPSRVADEKGERVYKWFTPTGLEEPLGPPSLDELPELPAPWVEFLCKPSQAVERVPAATPATLVDPRYARERAERMIAKQREDLEALAKLGEGEVDQYNNGWEKGVADAACQMQRLPLTPGCGYDEETAFAKFLEIVPEAMRETDSYTAEQKWHDQEEYASAKYGPLDVLTPEQKAAQEYDDSVSGPVVDGPDQAPGAWCAKLVRDSDGNIRKTETNLALIFSHDPVLSCLCLNEMSQLVTWTQMPPWRRSVGQPSALAARDVPEINAIVKSYFGGGVTSVGKESIYDAMLRHCNARTHHPVKSYLQNLAPWDGVSRIERCIPVVEDTPYTRQALLNYFLAAVQRIYEPGCKVDTILVLYGGQATRKTSWFDALLPPLVPEVKLAKVPDSGDAKDQLDRAHNGWIVQFDEIDNHLRSAKSQAQMKEFITGREDTWFRRYGREETRSRRQFVLGGTTNQEQFLLDKTGNRRYNVLKLGGVIPSEYLTEAWRDLLWAEALDRYNAGQRLDYSQAFADAAAAAMVDNLDDPITEELLEWLSSESNLHVTDVLSTGHIKRCVGEDRSYPELSRATRKELRAVLDTLPGYERSGRRRIEGEQYTFTWARIEGQEEALEEGELAS